MIEARRRAVRSRGLRHVFGLGRVAEAAVEVLVRAAVVELLDRGVAGKTGLGVEFLSGFDKGRARGAPVPSAKAEVAANVSNAAMAARWVMRARFVFFFCIEVLLTESLRLTPMEILTRITRETWIQVLSHS